MDKKNIRCSIVMATYNGEQYIKEQIDSILINMKENDELIISDDGSKDKTKQIIAEYQNKDKRIKLIDGPHKGVKQNFANAIEKANGKYIFLSDQDDIWKKDKIYKVIIKYKKQKKEYYYIHGNPTHYYSSIYHLEKTANNLKLVLNKENINEFDLKLIIWKNSKYVMGIVGATRDIKHDYNYSVLNDFVTKKCLLDFIAKGLKDSNLNQDLAGDSLKLVSVSVGDFSHGAYVETVTTQLIKVYNVLFKELETLKAELPKIFRYLQSDIAVNNNNYKGKTISRTTSFDE